MVAASPRSKIVAYLVLTFVLSSIFYYLIIASGSRQPYTLGLMWCPGVAAIITQLLFQRSLRDMGWSFRPVRYLLVSYGLPVLYCVLVYGLAWLLGLGRFDPASLASQMGVSQRLPFGSVYAFVVVYTLSNAIVGFLISCASALGEEIGWRGLLVPELSKAFPFTRTALISGAIWAVWHYPLVLGGVYHNAGAPLWFGVVCFSIMVLGLSFAFAWLRLKSGSLWTGVVLHASHNLFIQTVFTPLTGETGLTPYVIDEFGVGLALAALVIAYLFWRRRAAVPLAASL
jgi:membrane protease YdiL (CAAX protease family)